MLKALIGFLCVCFSLPAQAKLGETVPQLAKRFGTSYTIEPDAVGKRYRFRSEKLNVDVLVANGVSISETYFSDHPLASSGEPPNDIVRAILKTNAPRTRWVEMDAAPFRADYALHSSDHEYIALLRYTGPQPEDSVWTMTVGRTTVVGSVSTATPRSPATIPLATQKPTPTASATTAVVVASATPARHIDFSPEQLTPSPRPKTLEPLAPAEIARRAFPSVVLLSMQDARGQPISLGSGFFVGKDVVATNFHVIDQAAAGYAKVIGRSAKLNIKGIVGVDALHDLALLQVDPSSALPLPVAPNLSANVGDAVYAIGNPRGLEGTFSQGIVSSVRKFGLDSILQITAPISPGSSGGPVLDQTGTVVGVSVASVTNGQNLNFAIPANYVTALQRNQTELRPFKGVPRAKPQKTLLDHLGGQQPRAGITGEMLTYDDYVQTGVFSFSLHNKLKENVANIYGILIFYDQRGEPIDIYPINYQGVVPPGMAKRFRGHVDESVERLNCPAAAAFPRLPPRSPEGKTEFRVLDFSVTNE